MRDVTWRPTVVDGKIPFPETKPIITPERVRRTLTAARVRKHMGPGPHPSGSPQDVHGHGSSLVHVAEGTGSSKGQPISKELVHADGTPWTYSADLPDDLSIRKPDGSITPISAEDIAEVEAKIWERAREYGIDSEADIDANLSRLLDSAAARYEADPSLIVADRFYDQWHESLFMLHEETGIEMSRLIAAVSAISPGLDAERNLHLATDLARFIANEDQLSWSGDEKQAIVDMLYEKADNILNPVYDKDFHKIPKGKKHGDPRPPPKAARRAQGETLLASAKKFDAMDTVTLADMDDYTAAYVLHGHRKAVGSQGPLLGTVAKYYTDVPGVGIGFGVSKGYGNYGNAIGVLRGNITPDEALGDVKTRSFHNNILDPDNSVGWDDVTVDYHSVNFAFAVLGANENSAIIGSPKLEGAGLGVRPLIADSFRRLTTKYADVFPDGHIPARLQEIVWAEWRRGLATDRSLRWTSFDGKDYELGYVGKGVFRQAEQAAARAARGEKE